MAIKFTLLAGTQPHNHHFIILFDRTTNKEVTRQEVNNAGYRQDLVKAYPNIYNACGAAFDVNFTADSSLIGHQLQVISRWKGDPAGNGNTVDYYFLPKMVIKQNISASSQL